MNPDGPDYEAVALRCRACEAKDATADKWRRDERSDNHGVFFTTSEVS